jgi:hypothetical protein
MNARVTIITGAPDRLDRGIADFRENVAPWVREQGGRGAIMLVDPQTGNGMGITLWDDEEAMRASEQRADELRRGAAEDIGATQPPRVERYEVAVFET